MVIRREAGCLGDRRGRLLGTNRRGHDEFLRGLPIVCDTDGGELRLLVPEFSEGGVGLGEAVDSPLWLSVPYEDDVHAARVTVGGRGLLQPDR